MPYFQEISCHDNILNEKLENVKNGHEWGKHEYIYWF